MGIFSLLWNSNDSDKYDLSVKEYKENRSEPWDISYWFAFPKNNFPNIKFKEPPVSGTQQNLPINPRVSYDWYLDKYDLIDEVGFKDTEFISSKHSNYLSYNDAHNWMEEGIPDINKLKGNENDMIDSLLSLIIPGSSTFLLDPLLFPDATRLYHYYYDYESYDGMDYLERLDFLESKVELVFYKTNIKYNTTELMDLYNAWYNWSYQTYIPSSNTTGLIHSEFEEISKNEFIDLYNKYTKEYLEYLISIDDVYKRYEEFQNGNSLREAPCQYAFGLRPKANAELWGHPLTGEILISAGELMERPSIYEFSKNVNLFYDNFDFSHLIPHFQRPYLLPSDILSSVTWDGYSTHFHWINFIEFIYKNYFNLTYYIHPYKQWSQTVNMNNAFTLWELLRDDQHSTQLLWDDIDNQEWEWLGDETDTPNQPPTYNLVEYFDNMFDYHNVYWLIDDNGSINPKTIKVEAKLNENAKYWFSDIDKDMKFAMTYDPDTEMVTRVFDYDEVDNYQWSNRYKEPDVSNDLTVTPEEKVDKTKPNLWANGTIPAIILISVIAATIIGVPVIVIFKFKNK